MRTLAIIAVAVSAITAMPGIASAACPAGSPDAVTSKPPADAKAATDPQAAADAKGISEDGQHTPLETDPNAPGVTASAGGTTTNIAQAEAEIAAGTTVDNTATSSTSGTQMAAGSQDTACAN
ncbi:hypothetical protein ASG43_05295 [Aureimonas sp. Leaf454]|uniref:hypothetical protein n=1 Tax=Aureimonas sp. Leaf454 TaxID=1736381 RepID=UPI000701C28D|nr:hypothetical protein [Aureimonas sp. Leaf454]KQT50700.1 hypothetical protein ASG43_05295 [Aureimonas sp. Leaf454]